MSGYMYILECSDGKFYTGSTNNLSMRLIEHETGQAANFTAKRLPVKLVYYEEFSRIDEAFEREKQIQKWSAKKKRALIKGNKEMLKKASECNNHSHCKNNNGKNKTERSRGFPNSI
ncbi:MAG: GIY-YIG nuclease family protein [Bacteroidales bacterium]|nr:GIY-YIG nuclease family protein [Bacteroidales bacterium]